MKFAFVVPSGLWIGGVEKFTQQVAIELSKAGHFVDYFFTESMLYVPANVVHPGLDPARKKLVEGFGVRIIPVSCESAENTEVGGTWNNTNLFDYFRPHEYDVIVGSHKGEPTWPFSTLKNSKIVEFVHGTDFTSGASTYASAHVLINEYQIPRWVQMGGQLSKTHVVTPMVQIDMPSVKNDRNRWNLPHDRFIFGLHQGSRTGIFSNVQLDAFAKISSDKNFFVILGGGPEYQEQAEKLGLKNFKQIPAVSTSEEINSFLSCLNVFAHGRSDGEVCSSAIIEAMAHHLPIISHPGYNNGHISQLSNCGLIATSIEQYAQAMFVYEHDEKIRNQVISATKEKYENECTFEVCKNKLLGLLTSL